MHNANRSNYGGGIKWYMETLKFLLTFLET